MLPYFPKILNPYNFGIYLKGALILGSKSGKCIKKVWGKLVPKNTPSEFHPGQVAEINVNNDIVGIVGKLHPSFEKEDVYVETIGNVPDTQSNINYLYYIVGTLMILIGITIVKKVKKAIK